MKKIIYTLAFFGLITVAQAQETPKDTVSYWKSKGNVSLLFNQSNFSNWTAGGENNLSGNFGLNYGLEYAKGEWTWDNKLMASYGLVKTKNASFEKKTDDRLEFNSILGKKAVGNWSYSAFLNFRTQITKGYVYGKDVNGAEIRTESTDFLSPGYLTFGPGMLYKKDDNLKINIAPATSKLTFVDDFYTSQPGYVDGSYFGVDANESMRYEFGFYGSVYYKLNIMANVSAENILNLYSNYLEETKNVDVDYSLNIVMKINRYLSTNLSFQAIYDDNAFQGLQTRQVFGVGVNYGF
ncbi:DUF3078 domain-containing protein [Flavobacterium antarcticum]|uniref:DUF3078 domain-containing protein n=1 Tax=Flavobacterium antarcticum TaxID=271155 RepID=UPI0003B332F9|nr:DUF3078 domain-containing protein [Flavobacterium antarcticum]